VELAPEQWFVLIGLSAGIAGSSTAALISALNRQAAGYEDSKGRAHPDPKTKKERFSRGMYHWFLSRPALGGVTGCMAFWGMTAGFFGTPAPTAARTAFIGVLAGLFAKTLLDVLLNIFKNVFSLARSG
jgi:hypothetical protein